MKWSIRKTRAIDKVTKTGRKYGSLQREFTQQVRRFKANGKPLSRSLISRLERSRSNYEQAQKKNKALGVGRFG